MSNKFKVKKKLVSIALALALAAQPLASLPMNVFAGTGKTGVIVAPTVETDFDIDNIIELKAGETFNVNNYVKNIQPQGATVNYQFESLLAFEAGAVLGDDGEVTNPWIAKVKVTVGGVSKETYVIADINGMLNAAEAAAEAARAAAGDAGAACNAAGAASDAAASNAAWAAYGAAWAAVYAATYANGKGDGDAYDANSYGAYAAVDAVTDDDYDVWVASYKTAVDGVVSAIVEDYKTGGEQKKKDWLGATYAAVKAAKKMTDGKGLDLEAKLKIAHMAYRIAQFTWIYNTTDTTNEVKAGECKERADALQKVIDRLYSDKVGDIAEQAAKA